MVLAAAVNMAAAANVTVAIVVGMAAMTVSMVVPECDNASDSEHSGTQRREVTVVQWRQCARLCEGGLSMRGWERAKWAQT